MAEHPTCSWCGTGLRKGVCPRGPMCALEQDNHETLMEIIRKEKKHG